MRMHQWAAAWGLIMLLHFVVFVLAKEVELEFKVVPNKAGDIEVALDTPPIPSSTCRFEWDSSGATVEQWVAKVYGDPRSGELECEVARKSGAETYLMFTKFKTTLGTNPIIEALIHDNDGEMDTENFSQDDLRSLYNPLDITTPKIQNLLQSTAHELKIRFLNIDFERGASLPHYNGVQGAEDT